VQLYSQLLCFLKCSIYGGSSVSVWNVFLSQRLSLPPSSRTGVMGDSACIVYTCIHTVNFQSLVSLSKSEPTVEMWVESGCHPSYLSHSQNCLAWLRPLFCYWFTLGQGDRSHEVTVCMSVCVCGWVWVWVWVGVCIHTYATNSSVTYHISRWWWRHTQSPQCQKFFPYWCSLSIEQISLLSVTVNASNLTLDACLHEACTESVVENCMQTSK
jgi:hypothetical protein